jgi:hypothetical protein
MSPTSEALPEFDDPRVKVVYDILCDTTLTPPDDKHWEGFVARHIVAMLASAPASPAIGVQAVKDEMVERFMSAMFGSYNELTNYHTWVSPSWPSTTQKVRAALEAALHPAPEAASAGAECCSAISPCSWQRHNGMDDVCPLCIAATGSPVSPPPSDTAPSPKGAAGETERPVVNGHVLYVNSDTDKPEGACDGNGDLALGVCRVCGNFEAGLDDTPCPGPSPKVSDGVRDVLDERRRQIEAEGWTPEHDDEHTGGEIAAAAVCYAFTAVKSPHHINNLIWPWPSYWWKPTDKRRNLVKAGALILAEIERLDRSALSQEHAPGRKESQ